MNNTENLYVWKIRELTNVSEAEAKLLQNVIEQMDSVDWSEATNSEIKAAALHAQRFIRNLRNAN